MCETANREHGVESTGWKLSSDLHITLLETVSENTETCLVYLDTDFNFVWVNSAYARVCARSREEIIGHNHFEFYPHEENEAIFKWVRDTGQPFSIREKPFAFPDHPEWGMTYWDWTLTPVKDNCGTVQGLVLSLVDVTERIRTEQAIIDREEELAAVYENAPFIMLLIDKDRRVRKANKFAQQFAGAPAADMIDQRGGEALRCMHSLDDPAGCGFGSFCQQCPVRCGVMATLDTGLSLHQEEASLPLDVGGRVQEVTFLLSTSRFSVHGEPLVLVTIMDITARKQSEGEMLDLMQRLDSHMHNSPLAVIEWDPDYKIIRWSEEAQRVFGWSAEETLGKRIDELRWVYEADWPMVSKLMDDMNAGIRPRNVSPNRNYRKDGSIIHCQWYNSVLRDTSGAVRSVLSLVLDVTERERQQQELAEAREESEQLAGEMQTILSSMADGVMLADAEGSVVFMNEPGRQILEAPADESFEGWSTDYQRFTLDGKELPLEQTASYKALQGETVTGSHYRMITPWGKEIVIGFSASPVQDSEGRIIGTTTVFHDETEEVEFERQKMELYEREHHIAQMLQQALIPPVVPAQIHNYLIGVIYQPALKEAEVGGDFYDVFEVREGKIGILVGDVAGKGLMAAIRVAAARYALRSYAYIEDRPSKVLELANKALCKDGGDVAGILTAFFGVIDVASGRMTFSCAGHEPPIAYSAPGVIEELELVGMPLGITEYALYHEATRDLSAGDTIIIVTDGITEARTPDSVMFEKAGMAQYLTENMGASPSNTAAGLLAAAIAHAGGQLQDDAAVVVIQTL